MQTVPSCVHAGTAIIAIQNISSACDPRRRHSLQSRLFPSRRCPEAEGQAWLQNPAFHTGKLDGGTSRVTTYSRLRLQRPNGLSPAQTIRSVKLYHRQVYSFAYHRPKLAHVREDERHNRFAPLADFLERVPDICPHDLFGESSRASQLANFVDRNHLIVVEKENFATRTAALVLPAVGDNRMRHEALQRFMLANDSVTIAVEIPIWLTATDIDALEVEHGIRLLPPAHSPRALTGHIDFLQVRNDAVHILDYKPDARTNKPIAQLTLYALALTRLAGLRLFDIKCAWFNEEQYCEFFPRALLARQN